MSTSSLVQPRLPSQSGTAESYVEKLKNQQKQSAAFSVPKGRAKGSGAPFSISHYAGLVTYDTALFISKNTDPLHPELVEMASGSASSYVSQLFTKAAAASGAPASKRGTAMYSATIGSTFKTQLNELMTMIGATGTPERHSPPARRPASECMPLAIAQTSTTCAA